jgi:hypothetical protein
MIGLYEAELEALYCAASFSCTESGTASIHILVTITHHGLCSRYSVSVGILVECYGVVARDAPQV